MRLPAFILAALGVAVAVIVATHSTASVCTSEISPTSTSALASWINGQGPGSVGCMHSGTYGTGGQVYVTSGGSSTSRQVVRGYPGEPIPTIQGSLYFSSSADYLTVRLAKVTDGIGSSQGANYLWFSDLDVTNGNASDPGCITTGGSYMIVNRSIVHGCGSDRHFDHCGYVGHGTGVIYANNIVYGCAAWAFHIYPGPIDPYFHHNVVDASGSGVLFGGQNGETAVNARVENNAFTNMDGARDGNRAVIVYWPDFPGSGTLKNNCFWNNAFGNFGSLPGIVVSGNVTADPGYTAGHHISSSSQCRALVGDPAAGLLIPNP